MKHKWNIPFYYDGKRYMPVDGIIDIPIRKENMNPVEEIKNATNTDEKSELIKMAVELGCGAESSLKRNSIETLKKKIEEA